MIVSYAVLDAAGNLVKSGVCPEEMVDLQAAEGQTAVHGADTGKMQSAVTVQKQKGKK